MNERAVEVTGDTLTVDDVLAVARDRVHVTIAPAALDRRSAANRWRATECATACSKLQVARGSFVARSLPLGTPLSRVTKSGRRVSVGLLVKGAVGVTSFCFLY